jgi:hypothetical protein
MDTPTPTLNTRMIGATCGHEMVFPSGLRVLVTRIPLQSPEGASQLAVFINTEDMGDTDHARDPNVPDTPGGIPEMEVALNDAVLYDVEPGSDGRDRARDYVAPLWIVEHVDNVTTGSSHVVGKIHAADRAKAESLANRYGLLPSMQTYRIRESTDPHWEV